MAGNNGTMTVMQCPGLAIVGTSDLPGDFFLSFYTSRDLVMLSATGGVAWTKHEEQPAGRKQDVTGFWDFKRHLVDGRTYYSYHDHTGTYDNFGLNGFSPGETSSFVAAQLIISQVCKGHRRTGFGSYWEFPH